MFHAQGFEAPPQMHRDIRRQRGRGGGRGGRGAEPPGRGRGGRGGGDAATQQQGAESQQPRQVPPHRWGRGRGGYTQQQQPAAAASTTAVAATPTAIPGGRLRTATTAAADPETRRAAAAAPNVAPPTYAETVDCGGGGVLSVVVDLANVMVSLKRSMSVSTNLTAMLLDQIPQLLVAQGAAGIDLAADADGKLFCEKLAVDVAPDPSDVGSGIAREVHASLRRSGYALRLQSMKGPRAVAVQRGVDVALAVDVLRAGGALRSFNEGVRHVVLVSADSDFQPAIEALLTSVPDVTVWVIGHTQCMSRPYTTWLSSRPDGRARFLPLETLVEPTTKTRVLETSARMDPAELSRWLVDAIASRGVGVESVTAMIHSNNDAAFLTVDHVKGLARAARENADVAGKITQLWFDHAASFNDACLDAFAEELLPSLPRLEQLHVSDTATTWEGMRKLVERVTGATVATANEGITRRRLYVNAMGCLGAPEGAGQLKAALPAQCRVDVQDARLTVRIQGPVQGGGGTVVLRLVRSFRERAGVTDGAQSLGAAAGLGGGMPPPGRGRGRGQQRHRGV